MTVLDSLPSLPAPGQRHALPALAGSADAQALARMGGSGRLLTVITADPHDARRLADEIVWFAPKLRVQART